MPRQIWNEGRVVGYSAYEVYLKHALSVDPDHEPATEKEWLASMMAMGSSMLLRIGADPAGTEYDGLHYVDIQFPADSRLCAANTIIASFFDGEGYIDDNPSNTTTAWATKVTSYGSLIKNDSSNSPNGTIGHDGLIPPLNKTTIANDSISSQIKEYMKIVDGIIIQPGTWVSNPNKPPQKDFTPTLSEYPRLRIAFSERVTTPFFLLLTGFTNRSVVDGVTGFETAVNTQSPSDGDFLGPWAFPWSAKVIFSVPSSFVNYFMNNKYKRQLKSGTAEIAVKSDAIIDLKQNHNANLQSMYFNAGDDSLLPATITDVNVLGDDAAVFATYMHSNNGTKLPPALYAALLKSTGNTQFEPVDSVAPGSLHLYNGDVDSDESSAVKQARAIESEAYGNTAFIRELKDYIVYEINQVNELRPIARVDNTSLYAVLSISELTSPMFTVEGTFPRAGVNIRVGDINDTSTDGSDPSDGFDPFEEDGSTWYIIVDNKRVSGTTVQSDPLPYSTPFITMYKRLTGRLSNKIRNLCGYEYDPTSKKLKSDGIWDGATMDYVNQIPESERTNYYYVVFGTPYRQDNSAPTPVKKGTNVVDVCMKYSFSVLATKSGSNNPTEWIIPPFENSASVKKSSKYLGSWWGGGVSGLSADGKSATTYYNGWVKIHIDNIYHPMVFSKLPETSSALIYQKNALLPIDGTNSVKMSAIFTAAELDAAGIHNDYRNFTVEAFLRTALYTNMGDKSLLDPDNSRLEYLNICQPLCLYSNGYNKTSGKFEKDKQTLQASLTLRNTASNSGMTQLITLPKELLDTDSLDPQGIIITTGNLQRLALSMADASNAPYSIYGTDGDVSIPRDEITWETLLKALIENKTIDLLDDKLKGLKTSLKTASDGTYQIKITNGKVTLVNG